MTKGGGWKRILPALALLLLLAALLPALASACPLCKEADDGAAGTGMWRGMYWSILLMIGMPFSMFGVMVLMIVRARRRRQSGLPPVEAPLPFPDSRGARP
jgi:heme/copper-type cytochrome/quinol oxidase subunit 2